MLPPRPPRTRPLRNPCCTSPHSAAPFVHQIITEATTNLLTADGACTVSHGSGGLQGDSVAGEVFSCVYEPAVARWHQATTDPRLVAACPFTDEIVDTSLTVFADDLFRVIITDTCRAARLTLTVASNDRDLDREFEGIGVAQHLGEPEFCGAPF